MAYRQMLLIDLDEYHDLRKRQLYYQAPELTQDLYKLRETTSNLPVDQRMRLEGEVMRQHVKTNTAASSMTSPPSPPPPAALDDSVIVNNLQSFSRVNKQRANQIYQHLKSYRTQWNEMGQLLDEDGKPIPNSNIVELIDFVSNSKKMKSLPAGLSTFIHMMEQAHLPRNYLSAKGAERIEDYKHLPAQDKLDDVDMMPPSGWTKVFT